MTYTDAFLQKWNQLISSRDNPGIDSGAPVWFRSSGNYYLTGIHVVGNYQGRNCNAGVGLTEKFIVRMKDFISRHRVGEIL